MQGFFRRSSVPDGLGQPSPVESEVRPQWTALSAPYTQRQLPQRPSTAGSRLRKSGRAAPSRTEADSAVPTRGTGQALPSTAILMAVARRHSTTGSVGRPGSGAAQPSWRAVPISGSGALATTAARRGAERRLDEYGNVTRAAQGLPPTWVYHTSPAERWARGIGKRDLPGPETLARKGDRVAQEDSGWLSSGQIAAAATGVAAAEEACEDGRWPEAQCDDTVSTAPSTARRPSTAGSRRRGSSAGSTRGSSAGAARLHHLPLPEEPRWLSVPTPRDTPTGRSFTEGEEEEGASVYATSTPRTHPPRSLRLSRAALVLTEQGGASGEPLSTGEQPPRSTLLSGSLSLLNAGDLPVRLRARVDETDAHNAGAPRPPPLMVTLPAGSLAPGVSTTVRVSVEVPVAWDASGGRGYTTATESRLLLEASDGSSATIAISYGGGSNGRSS
jgi:hypothetical protein